MTDTTTIELGFDVVAQAGRADAAGPLLAAVSTVIEEGCPVCGLSWRNNPNSDGVLLHEPDCELGELFALFQVPGHTLASATKAAK